MEENNKKIDKSFSYLFKVYGFLFFLFIFTICVEWIYNSEIKKTILIILLGNLIIALINLFITRHLILHHKEGGYENKPEELLFDDIWDCIIRYSAGIVEMILYTVFFTIGHWEIVAGYLVVKVLSVWEPKSTKFKGLSTSGLRISIVLSLIFSIWASVYLNEYIKFAHQGIYEYFFKI